METKLTERGFSVAYFEDRYGMTCSIQKSSLAEEDCIWLGLEDAKPEIMVADAHKMGIATPSNNGWVPFSIPKEVLLHTRMHLTREQVAELLPLLQNFADTGDLYK